MWKVIALISLTVLGLIGGYSFVSGGNLVFNPEVSFITSTSDAIYLDSGELSKTVVVYQSNINLENATITSLCTTHSSFVNTLKNLYFFEIDYSQAKDCKNGNIVLSLGENDYANTIHKLSLHNDIDWYAMFIDYSSEKLQEFQKQLASQMQEYDIYKNYNGKNITKYYRFSTGQRKYHNAQYKNDIINTILIARNSKYISPVPERGVSTAHNEVPNAGRPYRESYTDGIHHGWDIPGDMGEDIVALDDGIIARIVYGFEKSDFSRIVYGEDMSEQQELKNLDILRGNQLWLKTMKGEVVFYSHLSFIEGNLEEGMMVEKGRILGKTGISGVPEEGYSNYHLHFSIMKNPYNFLKAGTYDFGDYMSWDWLTKGKSYSDVVQIQENTFQ